MADAADMLLTRLEGVRQTGPARWIARCPAHGDRTPSLSVREAESGAVLVCCHAGCPVEAVAAAVGMTMADLFPVRPGAGQRRVPPALSGTDALRLAAQSAVVVVACSTAMRQGNALTEADHRALVEAAGRLQALVDAVKPVRRREVAHG